MCRDALQCVPFGPLDIYRDRSPQVKKKDQGTHTTLDLYTLNGCSSAPFFRMGP
jgi:hypothetical protein